MKHSIITKLNVFSDGYFSKCWTPKSKKQISKKAYISVEEVEKILRVRILELKKEKMNYRLLIIQLILLILKEKI